MAINKQKPQGIFASSLAHKAKAVEDYKNFKISFEDYDSSQKYGSSFKDWQKCGLLSATMELLQGYCQRPLLEQIDGKKFTRYGNFPKNDETCFEYPAHVTPDADWARIHITGAAIIAGHIVTDTFYIVFLDKTHKFFLTKKARNIK
jgi:hypothetical protein